MPSSCFTGMMATRAFLRRRNALPAARVTARWAGARRLKTPTWMAQLFLGFALAVALAAAVLVAVLVAVLAAASIAGFKGGMTRIGVLRRHLIQRVARHLLARLAAALSGNKSLPLVIRVKARSSRPIMCLSRDRGDLPPMTTPISLWPSRLTEAARLKPEAWI